MALSRLVVRTALSVLLTMARPPPVFGGSTVTGALQPIAQRDQLELRDAHTDHPAMISQASFLSADLETTLSASVKSRTSLMTSAVAAMAVLLEDDDVRDDREGWNKFLHDELV